VLCPTENLLQSACDVAEHSESSMTLRSSTDVNTQVLQKCQLDSLRHGTLEDVASQPKSSSQTLPHSEQIPLLKHCKTGSLQYETSDIRASLFRDHSARSCFNVLKSAYTEHIRSRYSSDHSVSCEHSRMPPVNSSTSSNVKRDRSSFSSSEPESAKECSLHFSQHSLSSGERVPKRRECVKQSSQRLQYNQGSDSDANCAKQSASIRTGHRKDKEHETSSTEKPEERGEHVSFDSGDNKESFSVARSHQHDALLADDLHRLSVAATDHSKMKVKDCNSASDDYQAVLIRHVNQLFIRGDNVALVAIVG